MVIQLYFPWMMQFGLAVGIILLLLSLIILVIKRGSLKRITLFATALVILFLVFSWLPQMAVSQQMPSVESSKAAQPPLTQFAISPIGEPPASLLQWVIVGLLFAAFAVGIWLLSMAFKKHPQEDRLSQEADTAVRAIVEGEALKNVIVRSYLNMEHMIAQQQGIERHEAVTPREFETYLTNKGIPRQPILQLTRLFEKARYGNQNLNQQDEQVAMDCFIAIREACQTRKGES